MVRIFLRVCVSGSGEYLPCRLRFQWKLVLGELDVRAGLRRDGSEDDSEKRRLEPHLGRRNGYIHSQKRGPALNPSTPGHDLENMP